MSTLANPSKEGESLYCYYFKVKSRYLMSLEVNIILDLVMVFLFLQVFHVHMDMYLCRFGS